MRNYFQDGVALRKQIKELVWEYMQNSHECGPYASGLCAAEIFRECGLDWGDRQNATSSNQQYWTVALLRELESEGKVTRSITTKRWKRA